MNGGIGLANQVLFPIITKEMDNLPCFITGIGIEYEENGVIREEGYPDYQWAYCLEGEGIFTIAKQSYHILKGMAFFFKKDVPHSYQGITKPWRIEWITFNGTQVEKIMEYMGIGDMLVMKVERDKEIRQRIKDIFYTLNVSPYMYGRMLKGSGQLYEFLIFMGQNKVNNQNEARTYERLRPVITYMDTHYQNEVTLEQLAEQIGVTKYYLCRLFKEAYQSKPFDYLNQIRIQKAKEYLVTQEQIKVKEVGELVGFKDTSYFCLKFREYEGCSPLVFKQKYSV